MRRDDMPTEGLPRSVGSGEPAGGGGEPTAVRWPQDAASIEGGAPTDDGSELDALVDRLPEGWSRHVVDGRSWGVTRVDRAGGRATTIEAEELGGPGRANANVWRTARGTQLKPCEMPAEQVLGVLRRLREADEVRSTEAADRASADSVDPRSGDASGGARQP